METFYLFNYSNPAICKWKYLRVDLHHRNRDSESLLERSLEVNQSRPVTF